MGKKIRTLDPQYKLQQIRQELQAQFHERDDEIDSLLTALLAREHVLLLGRPGTAKSALARAVCEAIDGAAYFKWLLTKFSTPEELFGPISFAGLEKDEYRRLTKGKMPEAHVAFLDEIFKANSAILNSMLTIVNERELDNGTTTVQCPLETVVGASNELPEADSDGLDALYDRFLLRHWVEYIADHDAFKALIASTAQPTITTKLTLAELQGLQVQATQMPLPADLIDAVVQIRDTLAEDGIVASDRRWRQCMGLVRAFAVLNGHTEVEEDDLLILRHALWREPDQRARVGARVGQVASPLTAEALEILDAAEQLHRELLKKEGTADFIVDSVEARATLKEMRERLQARLNEAPGKKPKRVQEAFDRIRNLQADVKRRADRALD